MFCRLKGAHPYRIIEKPDHLLQVMTLIDKGIHSVTPYLALSGLTTAMYVISITHGAYSLMAICGAELGEKILGQERWSWRVWLGLPAIPFALISSRLSQADSILPLLPFIVLGGETMKISFPPSPALTLCTLPWIRIVYKSAWAMAKKRFSAKRVTGLATEARQGDNVAAPAPLQQRDEVPNENDEENLVDAVETRRDTIRLILGALVFP
ncbi:hypothetical protein HDU76_012877, partial [Blyttiomyces sp. JEL0837]